MITRDGIATGIRKGSNKIQIDNLGAYWVSPLWLPNGKDLVTKPRMTNYANVDVIDYYDTPRSETAYGVIVVKVDGYNEPIMIEIRKPVDLSEAVADKKQGQQIASKLEPKIREAVMRRLGLPSKVKGLKTFTPRFSEGDAKYGIEPGFNFGVLIPEFYYSGDFSKELTVGSYGDVDISEVNYFRGREAQLRGTYEDENVKIVVTFTDASTHSANKFEPFAKKILDNLGVHATMRVGKGSGPAVHNLRTTRDWTHDVTVFLNPSAYEAMSDKLYRTDFYKIDNETNIMIHGSNRSAILLDYITITHRTRVAFVPDASLNESYSYILSAYKSQVLNESSHLLVAPSHLL